MLVNEFIEQVADGTLRAIDDIISTFSNFEYKDSALFELWAYSVALDNTPTISNKKAIERIDEAIKLIEKHFGITLLTEPQAEKTNDTETTVTQSLNPEPQQKKEKQRD